MDSVKTSVMIGRIVGSVKTSVMTGRIVDSVNNSVMIGRMIDLNISVVNESPVSSVCYDVMH